MAKIILNIAGTGELVPVNDIDLESVTNRELIDAAIQEGIIPEYCKEGYHLYYKENAIPYTYREVKLSSLRIIDGSTVTIMLKPGHWGSF